MKEHEGNILNSTPSDISNITRGLSEIGARAHWSYKEYGYTHAVPDNARSEIPKHATDIRFIREGEVVFERRNKAKEAVHTHEQATGFSGYIPYEWRPIKEKLLALEPKELLELADQEGLNDAVLDTYHGRFKTPVERWFAEHPEYADEDVRKKLDEGADQKMAEKVD